MKTYIATFVRFNPQLGTYETKSEIEAKDKRDARRQAHKRETGCLYGSLYLKSLELKA